MELQATRASPLVGALDSFSRLEALATLYGPDTPRVSSVGTELAAILRRLAGETTTVALRAHADGVTANAETLDAEDPTARAFCARLARLGLVGIDIDVAATTADLHALAAALRSTGKRVELSTDLVAVEFDALPPTVRVLHREFGRRDVARSQTLVHALANVDATLEGSSLDAASRQAVGEWLGDALKRVVERVERPEDETPDPDAIERALDEVLSTASTALASALADALGAYAEHGELDGLCDSLLDALSRSSDAESVRSLTELLQNGKDSALDSAASARGAEHEDGLDEIPDDGANYALALPELVDRIGACGGIAKASDECTRECRQERIAIFVELLFDPANDERVPEILERLHTLIGPRLAPREVALFERALTHFLRTSDGWLVDLRLPAVDAVLGPERAALWLNVACQIAEAGERRRLVAIAPHLASELLSFNPALHPSLRRRIVAALGRVSPADLPGVVRRLGCTRVVYEAKIGAQSFQSLRPELSGFYRALFDSTRAHVVRPLLLDALKQHPPRWRGARVVATIDELDTRSTKLVATILEQGLGDSASHELALEVERFLVERLRRTPEEARDEPWIVPAIHALGELGLEDAAAELVRIATERKRLVLHAWPATARRAATEALAAIERTA